jgi:hypothetical protein
VSKRHRKPGKPPQIERPFHHAAESPARLHMAPDESRREQRIREENKATCGFLLTLIFSIAFVAMDIASTQAFTPHIDRAHVYDNIGLALFSIYAIGLSEYGLGLGRTFSSPHTHDQHGNQSRFHGRKFSIYPVLIRTYASILGLHLIALIMLDINLEGLLDPEVALHTSAAVGVGIALHAISVCLRYVITKLADWLMPNRNDDQYVIGDDGEVEALIAGDGESRYFIDDDGEIEKVKHSS